MGHLDGCKARIERAKAHLGAIDQERDRWLGYFSYTPEHDPDTGWYSFTSRFSQPPPLILGIIASDYLHQLRAALDNLICSLAELNEIPCTKDHAFPIVKKAENWKSAKNGRLKGLRAEHIAEIEGVQPFQADYDPDKHPVAVLDELNRLDKHRFLTPTSITLTDDPPEMVLRNPDGIAEIIEIDFEPRVSLDEGGVFLRIRVDPPGAIPQPDFEGLSTYLAFSERTITDAGLEQLGMVVDDIVNRPAFQP